MTAVYFSENAELDLYTIAAYIARDKPVAARNWVKKTREKCEMLAENPGLGQLQRLFGISDCRSFTIGNYVIFFRPVEDGIEVIRIIRGSQDINRF